MDSMPSMRAPGTRAGRTTTPGIEVLPKPRIDAAVGIHLRQHRAEFRLERHGRVVLAALAAKQQLAVRQHGGGSRLQLARFDVVGRYECGAADSEIGIGHAVGGEAGSGDEARDSAAAARTGVLDNSMNRLRDRKGRHASMLWDARDRMFVSSCTRLFRVSGHAASA